MKLNLPRNRSGRGLQIIFNLISLLRMRQPGCLILAIGLLSTDNGAAQITMNDVVKLAEARAHVPFHSPRADLSAALRQDNLDYDKYREIRFREDAALWFADHLHFRVEFYHPGYIYQDVVHIYEFSPAQVQPIPFTRNFFDYGNLNIQDQVPPDAGYIGFRLMYPLNQTNVWDELGAFHGASYFRLLGQGQRYGESARGLALDCGERGRPEEFPLFTDWWIGKPQPDDQKITLYAILDSVSCAGAYQFVIYPGETTVADVEAVLFFREPEKIQMVNSNRQPLKTIGLAPLTSMFWFGKNSERRFGDYRPEVHDSDGLLIRMADGKTFWQPLDNPAVLRHQIFPAPKSRGFGLLQRERAFAAYEDLSNLYHEEPSVWVEPHGNWGDGDLHLVELSTSREDYDNVVAFWDPKNKPAPLQPYHFGYSLYWTRETDMNLSENKVVSTLIGNDLSCTNCRQIVIDFAGPKLDAVLATDPPRAMVDCSSNAVVLDNLVVHNPFIKAWRVILRIQPKSDNVDPVNLRCVLQKGTNVLSETWMYRWSPPR